MMDLLIVILQQVFRFFASRIVRPRPVLVPVYAQPSAAQRGGPTSWVGGFAGLGTAGADVAALASHLAGYDRATWGHPLGVRPHRALAARRSRRTREPAASLRVRTTR